MTSLLDVNGTRRQEWNSSSVYSGPCIFRPSCSARSPRAVDDPGRARSRGFADEDTRPHAKGTYHPYGRRPPPLRRGPTAISLQYSSSYLSVTSGGITRRHAVPRRSSLYAHHREDVAKFNACNSLPFAARTTSETTRASSTCRGRDRHLSAIVRAHASALPQVHTRLTRLPRLPRLSHGENDTLSFGCRGPKCGIASRHPRDTLSPPLTPSHSSALSTIAASRVSRFR